MKKILISLVLAFSVTAAAQEKTEKPRYTFDISGSAGNYNGQAYSEVQLGVNWHLTDELAWRNAAFRRTISGSSQDLSGVDSSLRYTLTNEFTGGAVRFFAGPGYRWASESRKNALFADAGAGIQVGRVNLGGGVKYLRYDTTQLDPAGAETKRDDVSYFITVGGGFGLSF